MPAITITDLFNAKLDVDHIADIAVSASPTSIDRLGNTKQTMSGLLAELNATATMTAAATSAAEAQLALDAFDDRYLGSKASPPTVDNDGDPLIVGALYFDTEIASIRVWSGDVWVSASTTVQPFVKTFSAYQYGGL